jgi:hypothetical protein
MSSFLGPRQDVSSYSTVAAPQSLDSNDSPQAMKGSVRQVAVASSSGDQTSSGLLVFNIAASNASITRRTMFLRARVSVAYTATLPSYAAAASTTTFQGPGLLVAPETVGGATASSVVVVGGAYTQQLANAYSITQRSTLYSGGQVVDQINFLCDLMSGLILPHSTQRDWLVNDGANLIAVAQAGIPNTTLTTGGSAYWDLAIPLPHSCFNSERDFPLYLLGPGTPLSLQIDLTPITRAMKLSTSPAPTTSNFTISQASLCYEAVDLPAEFVDSMRARTKSTPFVLPQLSYISTQLPLSALSSYTCGLNVSSLRAAYVIPFNASSYSTDPTVIFAYNRAGANDVGITITAGNYSGTNAQLFCDGRLINSVNLDNPTMTFASLKQALNGTISNALVPSICTREGYKQMYFAIGLDATVFSDQSTVLGGTPCSQATISLTNFQSTTTLAANLATVIFAYDSLIVIKDGILEIKR